MSRLRMILGNLTIGSKIAVILAVVVLPLALLTILFVLQSMKDIQFAQKELSGTVFARQIWDGLVATTDDDPKARAAAPQTAAAIRKLTEAAQAFGAATETRDFADHIGSDHQTEALVAGQKTLQQVADGSNITLDPVLDTYYLGSALVIDLPELLIAASELHDSLKPALETGKLPVDTIAEIGAALGRFGRSAEKALGSLDSAASSNAGGTVRAALASHRARIADYAGSIRTIAGRALQNGVKGEPAGLDGFLQADDGLGREVDPAWTAAQAQMQRLLDQRVSSLEWTLALNLTGIALCLLIAVGAVVAVSRSIRGPVADIVGVLDRFQKGDYAAEVKYTESRSEFGAIARAAQSFKETLQRAAALEAEDKANAARQAERAREMAEVVDRVGAVVASAARGDFSRRVEVTTQEEELARLVAGVNEINSVVDRATGEFAVSLGAIARGDLTVEVTSAYDGRLDDLKTAINETIARLSETVATIQMTTIDVNAAAREISSGSDDLSRRTEGQAASLEQTAATTEELAASVKATAQAAQHAVALAGEARGVASEGGVIVERAVGAMARIEEQSQKIQQITSVIDTIAFQTNLLALNAAVEAARAGDAGKGFAVVASEVRALAQRSSEAAKDIAGLISTSVREVEEGATLVRSTGEALGRILQASEKVSSTVAEISTATAEQSHGIDEMSQAVTHMDEMTQQNAALAEESAASATSLSDQIQRLEGLVASFRTSSAGTSAPVLVAERRAPRQPLKDASPVKAPRKAPEQAAPRPAPKAEPDAKPAKVAGSRWTEF